MTAALALRLARAALPPGVAVGAVAVGCADLWPAEGAAVAQAVPARQAGFAAGRAAARAALAGLGLPPVALPAGADRLPVWPAGLAGSISHTDAVAVAAVARAPLSPGIDVEPEAPLPPDVAALVVTGDDTLPPHPAAGRILFSAKEAAFKAQFPLTRAWLDFGDMAVALSPDGTLTATLRRAAGPFPAGHAFAGRWRAEAGLILTAVVATAPDAGGSRRCGAGTPPRP